ncbi:hypothetical protein [Haloferula sp.]|uniref:hypothetical protein n=1 Tax=Haloferula sp. TaxID=2497595 RepID=UPI00329FB711
MMKTKYFSALCAAAVVSLPSMASAQLTVGEPRYGDEVDSVVTFNFTVSRVGSIRDSNGQTVLRTARERFNQRNFIDFVADREDLDLPLGVRLIIIADTDDVGEETVGGPGVYIGDNFGNPLFDVSEYFVSTVDSEAVVVGNYRKNSTSASENSQSEFVTTLRISLPDDASIDEEPDGEVVDDFIEVSGIAKNRYQLRLRESFNSIRITESTKTDVRTHQGSGQIDGRAATVTGKMLTSGRDNRVIDTDPR